MKSLREEILDLFYNDKSYLANDNELIDIDYCVNGIISIFEKLIDSKYIIQEKNCKHFNRDYVSIRNQILTEIKREIKK